MKKAFVWFLSLLILACGSFAVGRYYREHHPLIQNVENPDWDNGFRASDFPLQKHSFVIFVCGFNNGAFVEKTLRSIFSQVYDNYRLIYVDDGSTDGSFELARDCISQSRSMDRTTFVRNETRLGLLSCLMRAIQGCKDHEIVVLLRGHDWLAHQWVLNRLNQYYANPDLWLTYGQYREFPSYRMGSARNYLKSEWKTIREAFFAADHLPAFYAALCKRINENDLLFQGSVLPQRGELAVMLPMLEMAKKHYQFIPEILCISNSGGEGLEDRDLQVRCEKYIRSLKPYSLLSTQTIRGEPPDNESEGGG
jgi:glycosyltransferase involved in cell wall biosynthesis